MSRHPFDDEASGLLGGTLSLVARRPFDMLAATLAAACTVMIFVNALVIQQGRPSVDKPRPAHQAAQAAPAPQRAEAPKRSDLVHQVQTALAERDLYDGVVDGVPGAATASAIRAFEQSQGLAPTGEASEKILAALLTAPMRRADAPRPAKPAASATPVQKPAAPLATGSTASAQNAQSNPTLMAAQRTLAKIGYGPVSIDGKLGAETRNAIRSFERDRGLPETGELTPAVLRALSAMTGTPLQ